MRTKNWKYLLAMGVASWMPVAAFANLVIDGDFTPPPNGGGSFDTIYSPGATIGAHSAWTVTGGSVDVIGGYWQVAPGSVQTVDMSGYQNGTIQQDISLAAGTYRLSFYMSGNPDGPPSTKELQVSLGSSVHDFSYTIGGNTHANMMYQYDSVDITVGAGSTPLIFQDLSAGTGTGQYGPAVTTPWGAVIGNVSLTAVPEPTTLISGALMLLPFGASTLRILRRNRAA